MEKPGKKQIPKPQPQSRQFVQDENVERFGESLIKIQRFKKAFLKPNCIEWQAYIDIHHLAAESPLTPMKAGQKNPKATNSCVSTASKTESMNRSTLKINRLSTR
jgi:hypothetical protein